MPPFRLLFPLFAFLSVALATRAQSVRWEPSESGVSSAINLVFENCEPEGQPAIPAIPGVTLTLTGSSTSTNIVNFRMTHSVVLSYFVRGPQNPPIQIPAFTVKTNKGALRVEPFNVAAPAAPIASMASARLIPGRTTVWAGEIFPLDCEATAARRVNPQFLNFDWKSAPLVAEDWSKPEVSESVVNGERRMRLFLRTRAIALNANTIKLEPATFIVKVQTGTIPLGLFAQARMEDVSVNSDQPVIEVRPLPAGAPAGFGGAVGQFKLTSKVVPEKAAIGEPVTWTLELSGTGNWPAIEELPAREVSKDFQIVQPKPKRTPAEGKLFEAKLAEDVVLVPTKAGTYALGPVTFAYFDPQDGSYKTLTTPRTTLAVAAPAAPPIAVPAPAGPAGVEPGAPSVPAPPVPAVQRPLTTPELPAGIPRDPLPGTAVARVPLATRSLVVAVLIPFAGLLAFWVWLALRRARETDPVRPRREARDRLARTLAELPEATGAERVRLLLAWQHDTAVLWQLRHAAPAAGALDGAEWSALWREADRTLYGAKAALPSDWIARAQAALAAKVVPGFRPLRLFLPRNLMPFAAVLAVAGVGATAWLHAAEPTGGAAYRKADFPAAEKAWRATLEAVPTDWIARHNLSLALEQQDRSGEAAAQAAAAFVQNPAEPAVRWHFARTAEKLGAAPAALAGFVTPGLLHALAQLASPADWQRLLIAAAWLATLGLGALLLRAYGHGPRVLPWISGVLIVAAVALAAIADAALLTYGLAAKADAVIVSRASTLRSIPTEADTTQKTSTLGAGSLAVADRSFLGWRRLAFENGQTGWVRKDDLVPIWK